MADTYEMTIAGQLQRIEDAKADIRDAIVAKGVTVEEDVRLNDYASKIALINESGDLDELTADWYDPNTNTNGDLVRNIEEGSMVIRQGRRTTSDITVAITDIDPDALDYNGRAELVARINAI